MLNETTIHTITLVQDQFTKWVLIPCFFIGNITNILNCFIFLQQSLRTQVCPIYFVCVSITNLFVIDFLLLTRVMMSGFEYDPTTWSDLFCKLRTYLWFVFSQWPRSFLVLTCIDRYLISSPNANYRKMSQKKYLKYIIPINIFLWSALPLHVPFNMIIINRSCVSLPGFYYILNTVYNLLTSAVIPILILSIFSLLIIKNVHRQGRRIHGLVVQRRCRNERHGDQLTLMLLSHVLIYIIINLLNPIFQLYLLITDSREKSLEKIALNNFINVLSIELPYVSCSLTFCIYTLTSKTFRTEFKRLINRKVIVIFKITP
ncbi:unnamed protein product [Didymodactylos carnosus]|uniref:G-protein coupled receptors family 1 profile domain-containing protein n=1 Tax=Didymodactylos carnosus TaxID=1234261 RepID=A0A814RZX7_9BILA|nr:unnamed protein product [Didymodactylos carnosus]CAF1139665.1 unnamed protein product [Didymodactylos carnosus]CAF3494500.1 unnamed protein product [Didymodactylos carnosus]CAF3903420.1 unnamed protein product [Didymodactylos carnosus]